MLNNIGLPGLLLIAVVLLVLFGRGKVSSLMGEVGKGITAFKKGVKDGSEEEKAEAAALETGPGDELAKARAELAAERAKLDAERARVNADAALRDVTPADHNKL
nr:twin-arginine translocase TatA/TatE family subunit [Paracoccus ravus]